jgi:DNA-binding beta-propeller fold protein YncE
MLVLAAPASADPWRPAPQSCFTYGAAANAACKPIRGGKGTWQIAFAPGGRHAYGISSGGELAGSSPLTPDPSGNALMVFDRNPATGVLTQRGLGCLSEPPSDGTCIKARGLLDPTGVVVSPDGNQVYVASYKPGGIAVFDRNPENGDLVQKEGSDGCISNTGASSDVSGPVCADGRAMPWADTLAITPDGRTLFLGAGPIAVFQRDPLTGVLSQASGNAGCVEETPSESCADAHGLAPSGSTGVRQVAVSPDGRSVYVPNSAGNALTIFDRDPNSGQIAQKDGVAGCLAQTANGGVCAVEPTLSAPRAVSVSPNANQVYVSVADGVVVFARAQDGGLTRQSCVNDSGSNGCTAGSNMTEMTFSAVSPDGQALAVSNERSGYGFSLFELDPYGNLGQTSDLCVSASGVGRQRGVDRPGLCMAQPGMAGYGAVTFADDNNLIVASYHATSLASFKRDFYPVCQNQTVSVTQNVVAVVPLACRDRNGDALSLQLNTGASAGVLGEIEQAASRVFYNPFANFVGTDSFSYRASANGLISNTATATLNVVAPVLPPPKPLTVDASVSYRWSYGKKNFTIRRLVVRRLPVGATFTIICSGKRCPYKRKTIKRSRKSTMNVLRAKSLKKKVTFRAKQTIQFRVAAPGMNTKVLRFKLKSKKQPDHQTYCIPLGSKKLKRTC